MTTIIVHHAHIPHGTMSYKRPSDERLNDALVRVLLRCKIIESQNELVRLVVRELERDGETYRVSGNRVRRFALENDMVSLEIDYRNRRYVNVPDMCPVCGGDLISVSNSTLDGDTIEIQRRCGRCSYSSGSRGTIPGRYVFIRRSGGLSLSKDDRIERLDRAKELMEEACDILESLIDGHVLAHHAVSTVEILREKISSDGDPGSIRNMRRCLETDEGHPGWTRPLDSVKNVHRKVL